MSGDSTQDVRQLSMQLEELQQERELLDEEISKLQDEKAEIRQAVSTIEALESGMTVQVPLGGGAHVRAEVQDVDEVVVEFGGGYAAERTQGEAVETLKRKQKMLDEEISDLRSEVSEVESETQALTEQAQRLQQQQLRAQMQQMQQDE